MCAFTPAAANWTRSMSGLLRASKSSFHGPGAVARSTPGPPGHPGDRRHRFVDVLRQSLRAARARRHERSFRAVPGRARTVVRGYTVGAVPSASEVPMTVVLALRCADGLVL